MAAGMTWLCEPSLRRVSTDISTGVGKDVYCSDPNRNALVPVFSKTVNRTMYEKC